MEEEQSSGAERRFLEKDKGKGGSDDDSNALVIGTILLVVFIVLALLAVPLYRKMKAHLEQQRRRREREARIRKDLAVIISSGSEDEQSAKKTKKKTFVQTGKIDVENMDEIESPDKLVKKNLQIENPMPIDLVVNYKQMKKQASQDESRGETRMASNISPMNYNNQSESALGGSYETFEQPQTTFFNPVDEQKNSK